jgi:hypothetical protein
MSKEIHLSSHRLYFVASISNPFSNYEKPPWNKQSDLLKVGTDIGLFRDLIQPDTSLC